MGEDWSYYESVYFMWVSISTIGYGDFVPETRAGQWVGLAVLPLGLGTCALLLAAIAQWFQDLITWFDHDNESYNRLLRQPAGVGPGRCSRIMSCSCPATHQDCV